MTPGTSSARRVLSLLLLAGLGFSLVAAALRPLVPWPEDYGLASKMRWWDEHADEYDLVFVGSSRVFRAFDPRVFEVELARAGVPLRAFNFGVGGVQEFEMDGILRALLARRPSRLGWVLYEGGPMDPRFALRDNVESARVVHWHTPGRTRDVLHSIAHWPFAPEDERELLQDLPRIARVWATLGERESLWRLDLARRHVQVLGWNLTNYGQGRAILGRLLAEDLTNARRAMFTPEELARGQGYIAFEENADESDERRAARLRDDPQGYAETVRTVAAGNDDFPPLETLNLPALAAQHELVRAAGAKLVFVVPPDRSPRPDRRALEQAGLLGNLLDFNQPEHWPELFALESRYDPGHLSRAGAVAFSSALAREFAARMQDFR
jgi:hypothetical protein